MRENMPPRQLKLRSAPLSVAFSLTERDAVANAAHLSGESVSAFIRAAAVKAAERVNRQQEHASRKAA